MNDIATKKERDAAARRSAAAKKAAKTRKENEEAATKAREEEEAAAAAKASSGDNNPDQASGSDEGNGQTGDNLGDQSSGNDGDSGEKLESQVTEKVGPRWEPLSYKPNRVPLEGASLDQHAAEKDRQAELDAEREEHNRRTGDPSITGFKY